MCWSQQSRSRESGLVAACPRSGPTPDRQKPSVSGNVRNAIEGRRVQESLLGDSKSWGHWTCLAPAGKAGARSDPDSGSPVHPSARETAPLREIARTRVRLTCKGQEGLRRKKKPRPASQQPSLSGFRVLVSFLPFFFSSLPSVFLGSLTACTSFRGARVAEVHEEGRCAAWSLTLICSFSWFDCRLSRLATRQFVTFLVVTLEATTVSNILHLAPRWNRFRWRHQNCRFPPFFDSAQLRLSVFAEGRHVEVTSNGAHVVQLGDFPELTKKNLRNASPLRGHVAQVNRGRCVRALTRPIPDRRTTPRGPERPP